MLNLPIDSKDQQSAKLSIIYIFDLDQYVKYTIYFKPGKYNIMDVMERVKHKVSKDRKEVKNG